MLNDIVKGALELLKLAPRYLIAITLITAALLFLPKPSLSALGVVQLSDSYRQWLGLGFLGSLSLLTVSAVSGIMQGIRGWRRRRKTQLRTIEKLKLLTEPEKQILRYYFVNDTRSNVLRVDDGVANGLAVEGVIYRSSQIGNLIEGFAHNISDLAWDYLHLNPYLLDGTTATCRTDARRRW